MSDELADAREHLKQCEDAAQAARGRVQDATRVLLPTWGYTVAAFTRDYLQVGGGHYKAPTPKNVDEWATAEQARIDAETRIAELEAKKPRDDAEGL